MKKKDCVFQYATEYEIIEDTALITREEGEVLWKQYTSRFLSDFEGGSGPEMVLWVNMETPSSFHTSAKHWHHSDMLIVNGVLYERVEM